jgi:hypothetical protein
MGGVSNELPECIQIHEGRQGKLVLRGDASLALNRRQWRAVQRDGFQFVLPPRFLLHGAAVFLVVALAASAAALAQDPLAPAPNPPHAASASKHGKHPPPELPPPPPQPNIVIPVTPLGFAPPAPFYLGDRVAQVSLNFLDEDNLLFTFRVPGLIAREHLPPNQAVPEGGSRPERHVRAVVLSLPSGKVTAEALWRLHDYGQFLWVLNDRRFLLRDWNTVQIGDSALHLTPFLRFPGPVNYLELDPDDRLLVAETSEEVPTTKNESKKDGTNQQAGAGAKPGPAPGASSLPSAASSLLRLDSQDDKPAGKETESLLRILRMDTGEVMFLRHVPGVMNLPLDGEGYYEALRGNGLNWLISYTDFSGRSTPVLPVESTCYPALDVMAPGLVVASACQGYNGRKLTALMRDPEGHERASQNAAQTAGQVGQARQAGQAVQVPEQSNRRLWEISIPPTKIWPLFARASNGLRIARATLDVTRPIGPNAPLDISDIRVQSVQVYDLATGKLELTVPAYPVLDGGGGFALSPSGKRFAVLNAGAIQIFDLPPVPAIAKPQPADLSQSNQARPDTSHP